ncbi:MAG: ComEC/Rec2 family competence protein [Candidatus Omnitrophota bacterium]|nr:ComEC/Rec2 family competence protein [Candidatus Omnitrophota bacterium]
MKLPILALFTICFCIGICLGRFLRIPFLSLYAVVCVILAVSFVFIRYKAFIWLLFILAISLGSLFLSLTYILPLNHIKNFILYKGAPIFIKGTIISFPQGGHNRSSFILSAKELICSDKTYSVSGEVLVKAENRKEAFFYGDRLLLEGRLYRPFSFSKEFNYRDYLRRQGIYCVLSVKGNNFVKRLERNAANLIKLLILKLRLKIKKLIGKNLSSFSGSVLNAIILGDRQGMPFYVRDSLLKSGTVHIISISGFHIGIIFFIILVILKTLRILKKTRYLLAMIFLVIYCVLTGAGAPVVRATMMAGVLSFSYFLRREADIYNSLFLAALIILIINPCQLFEISFQLSFLSVLSIVWLQPKIKAIFPNDMDKVGCLRFLILLFCASSAASLGLLPLVAYYFKIITPITVLANMIIVPYISIVVACGFALGLVGLFVPVLAPAFAATCELSILLLFKINSLLISFPGAYFKLPTMPFYYILLYYILLVSIFGLFPVSSDN